MTSRGSSLYAGGTTYAGYQYGGPLAIDSITDTRSALVDGLPPFPNFNLGLWLFPLKKLLPGEDPAASHFARKAMDARPLTCKTSENKAVGGTVANALKPVTVQCTSPLQNGFVPGRQMLANILEVDTISRAQAFRCMFNRNTPSFEDVLSPEAVSSLAVSAFFDFASAFPSVNHEWIFTVLRHIQAPVGLVNLVKAMYLDSEAHMVVEGKARYLFPVRSGVLQGCPLSALLFNFAIDPLLWLFSLLIVKPSIGRVLACADDLAACISSLHYLKPMHSLFRLFGRITGLTLSPKKCVIVLNSVRATPYNVGLVRAWLAENIPDWADFEIANCAKYLGFYMGPTAFCWQWDMPIRKFKARVESIASSGESAALCARQYSIRAVPILSYLSQLSLPPPNLPQIEIAAINRILHFATNATSFAAIAHINNELGLGIRFLAPTMQASMLRTALATVCNFQPLLNELWMACEQCMPVIHCSLDRLNPPGWDSPPMVCNLKKAANLDCVPAHARTALQQAINKSKSSKSCSLQKSIYTSLVSQLRQDWIPLLSRRLAVLCQGEQLDTHSASWFFFFALDSESNSVKIMALRTLLNSWATSWRYHENVQLSCVFGCGSVRPLPAGLLPPDSLQHYLSCPILWRILESLLHSPLPTRPSHRLCLTGHFRDCKCIALAHSVYHGIKNDPASKLRHPATRLQLARLWQSAFEIGQIVFSDLY